MAVRLQGRLLSGVNAKTDSSEFMVEERVAPCARLEQFPQMQFGNMRFGKTHFSLSFTSQ
jgi:hypothetical protein